jgi:hypothetical protein
VRGYRRPEITPDKDGDGHCGSLTCGPPGGPAVDAVLEASGVAPCG